MKLTRSILSILSGLAVFFIPVYILWKAFGYGTGDIPSDWFFALSVVVEILLGLAAGLVTALLAKEHILLLTCVLAGFLAFQNLAYIMAGPAGSPVWPYGLSLALVTPAVLVGGHIYVRHKTYKGK